jgi:hypothetical protein
MTALPDWPAATHKQEGMMIGDAFLTIRPLIGGTVGQKNYWIVSVSGWRVSAPTVRELVQMLRDWFAEETSDE